MLAGTMGLFSVGCQLAERPRVAPVEPVWSYHDNIPQLSNNDAWNRMIPTATQLGIGQDRLASVEDPTR